MQYEFRVPFRSYGPNDVIPTEVLIEHYLVEYV